MIPPHPPFDRYLARLARGLAGTAWHCRAVLPEIDGGLLFRLHGTAGEIAQVRLSFDFGANIFQPALRFSVQTGAIPSFWCDEMAERFATATARQPHPLLAFWGQEVERICLRPGQPLPDMWQPYLLPGQTHWGPCVLTDIVAKPGALYLEFAADAARVRLRLTNHDDPRTEQHVKRLVIHRLALSLVHDDRTPAEACQPALQVERFVAYLFAHVTGVRTRLEGSLTSSPDATLYGQDLRVNQFLSEARQGASGMTACLFGQPRQRLKILSFGDPACRQTFPPLDNLRFFDSWSYFPVRTVDPSHARFSLDFSPQMVIGGGETNLTAALDEISAKPDQRLAVIQTCVSRLIGDDVAGVLRERFAEHEAVVLDPDFQHQQQAVDARLWRWLFAAYAPDKPLPHQPNHINLVGFGHEELPATAEMITLLGQFGVTVNCCLFPSFDEVQIERFGAAALTVVCPAAVVTEAFAGVVHESHEPEWIAPPPPFGLAGTSAWLFEVLRHLHKPSDPAALQRQIDDSMASFGDRLQTARAELDGTAVAFACSARFCSYLFRPADVFAIPLLALFDELGLSADIFLLEDAAVPVELAALSEGQAHIRLHCFKKADALVAALRQSPASLLFTSIRRNRWALSLGKVPLGARTFEMGAAGCLRTARRLSLAAHWPLRFWAAQDGRS